MRLLFVTNEVPYPPTNGVRIPSFNAIRILKELGWDLAIAVLTFEQDDVDHRFEVLRDRYFGPESAILVRGRDRPRTEVFLTSLRRRVPYFVAKFSDDAFMRQLEALASRFKPGAVHLDLIPMLQYRALFPLSLPVVASVNDCLALSMKNSIRSRSWPVHQLPYRFLQFFSVRRYEREVYQSFDTVHVMTKVDAAYLQKLSPKIRTTVIPNGVDPELFDLPIDSIEPRFIFVGKLEGQNLSALRKLLTISWPRIVRSIPRAQLAIFGKVDTEARSFVREFNTREGVEFHGFSPNLSRVYAGRAISFAPIDKDCGLVNKAIEAMAAGVAVIGFERTFKGIISAEPGINCESARDYEHLASVAAELWNDKERLQRMRGAGRLLARTHYTWESREGAFRQMYAHSK